MSAATKNALRQQLKSQRRVQTVPNFAAAAIDWLASRTVFEGGPGLLAAFQATPTEPDITTLLQSATATTAIDTVLIPSPTRQGGLGWVVASQDQLGERPSGIPRPAGRVVGYGAPPIQAADTILLVPALAIDPDTGVRLGYGGGYYDRLLAELRQSDDPTATVPHAMPLLVGVCFERECRPVPAEAHDEPVTHIMTEIGVRPVRGPR